MLTYRLKQKMDPHHEMAPFVPEAMDIERFTAREAREDSEELMHGTAAVMRLRKLLNIPSRGKYLPTS